MKSRGSGFIKVDEIMNSTAASFGLNASSVSHGYTWADERSDFTKGFFLFTAILSFVGNLLVLILFLRNRKWLKKAYGRFILELAIVDILTAACLFAIPITIHIRHRMSNPRNQLAREMYCRLLWSHYLLFSLGVTSVYTCLVLTIERWVAVVKPFQLNGITPSRRSLFVSLALPWFAGFALEANVVMETAVVNDQDGTFVCQWDIGSVGTSASSVLAITSFLGAILLPAVFIVFMYGHILFNLQRENIRRQSLQQPQARVRSFYKLAFRRTTKMAACATITVVICWLPCQLYTLLANLGYVDNETTLHKMLNLLAFFNSCLNPFIYAFSNAAYRKRFLETFASLKCQQSTPSMTDNPSVFV